MTERRSATQRRPATEARAPDRRPERAAARLGPRPLPWHLGVALATWMSCTGAWPLSRSGSLPWRPQLAEAGERLSADLQSLAPEAFAEALGRESRRRLNALLAGILAYRRHPYRRDVGEPPAIWQEGATRLVDYGGRGNGEAGPAVLAVPSLINRAYILDLKADLSLLRSFAAAGPRVLLVDWGRPGADERDFTLTEYIAGRLEAALDAALESTGGPLVVMGYCMGGLLALALAQRRQRDLAGLALLATPWDFHAQGGAQARLAARGAQSLEPLMQALGVLPVDAIQMLFASLDPQTAVRKFLGFARLDPDSARATTFVALEDWLNDGVPLAAGVARECLYGWYGENTTARGTWCIAGRGVDPARVRLPALCLVPAADRIVPPGSALALARALPRAQTLTPPLGHIGMVASARARQQAWEPLLAWLTKRGGAGG